MTEDMKAGTEFFDKAMRQPGWRQASTVTGFIAETDKLLRAVLDISRDGMERGAANRDVQAQGRFQVICEMVEIFRERRAMFIKSLEPFRCKEEEYRGGGNS
ncbi:MAG: hypothetical protein H6Q84_2108 [Deltaproteobacteria bacterium]|nr:hypothetical protein [Deltaproteobacteria bacterium]